MTLVRAQEAAEQMALLKQALTETCPVGDMKELVSGIALERINHRILPTGRE